MNANLISKSIEMTANEAKKAGKIGTEEFKELREYLELYPNYAIVIKTAPKRKNEFKGLDYNFMKSYIKEHDDEDGTKMARFLSLTGQDENGKIKGIEVAGYLDVKDWFLDQFPEIKAKKEARRNEIKKILAA